MSLIILGIVIGIIAAVGYKISVALYNDDTSHQPIKFKKNLAVVAFVVPVLLLTALSSFARVGTGEVAVMTRFGRVTGQELGEGVHFINPVDEVNIYDVKVLKEEADASAASKDLQDANAKVVVNYRLERGKVSEIHRTLGKEYKAKLIDPAIQEVFKASTAKFNATEMITERAAVKKEAYEALQGRLERYGIVVQDLSITNFSFSKEFANSIEAKQVAAQNAEAAKFNLEKSRIDAEAQNLQKTSISPELLQKLAIEKWNGVMPTTVAGGGTVFNIPLK